MIGNSSSAPARNSAYNTTPFGNPDGSRANLDQINKGFVDFGNSAGGLSTPESDLGARVLVGRKGSGKTLYLRRLQAHASNEKSVYADFIQQDLPSTDAIVRYCQWFKTALNERWIELWRKAIMRSVVSHMLTNLKESLTEQERIRLSTDFEHVVREFTEPVSVYSQLGEIVNEYRAGNAVQRYFSDPGWNDLESLIAKVLTHCPPICFYLDAVDEEFENAPMYWLECQKGLFLVTMRLLRHAGFGGRLHVITCIRDVVLSSILRSENATRYKGEPHIRVLSWNRSAIEYFLREKLHKLRQADSSFGVRNTDEGDPVSNWLGVNEIENNKRQCRESIVTYLLRHTRLLPRDLVMIGNLLSQAVNEAKLIGNEKHLQTVIRDTVSKSARLFGNEQLAICATEMVAAFMPENAAAHGYADVYLNNKSYASEIAEDFKKLIASMGADRFSSETFERGKKRAEQLFGKESDAFSILWRNRLIGYVDGPPKDERYIFYSDERMDEFCMPQNHKKRTYVLHPVLIDAVDIRSNGRRPVVPFN